jgi:hypothetical protein
MNPLEAARTDRVALLQQREALDQKIKALDDAIKILETVYRPVGDDPLATLTNGFTGADIPDLGLTSAVERVLMELPGLPFPPTRVRDTLVSRRFKLSGDNPMASIHQVLKRLVARIDGPFVAEEVNGQTVYKYDQARDIDHRIFGRYRSAERALSEIAPLVAEPPVTTTLPTPTSAPIRNALGIRGASKRLREEKK